MVEYIIRWSLANRFACLFLSALLVAGGAYLGRTMSVDVFPDLTAPTVTVIVEGHGLAPDEMERRVTFPIETALNGAADVRRVRSGTTVGLAVVWVEFDWGADVYRARQTVAERLASVAGSLPETVEPPTLAPISSIMGEIMFAALYSDRHAGEALKTYARTEVQRRLLSVAGVSQVTLIGGDDKQYRVVLSPQRLASCGLTVHEVAEALRRSNRDIAAGVVVEGSQESVVQGLARLNSAADIEDVVVTTRGESAIQVRHLGVVEVGAAMLRGDASASFRKDDGSPVITPAVIIAIQKQPHANTLELTEHLDDVLGDISDRLPEGMALNSDLFRQAPFIRTAVDHTVEAMRDGGVIVILIVLAFLASLRASVITLLAIPLSLAVTLIALWAIGATINTMTLGGMAIAVGALVDDAIIDVENIVRRLRENRALPEDQRRGTLAVIFDASIEVRASIVFATLIIILVFSPIFFLSGVEGRLLKPLGLAFCIALLASMAAALTLTPALSSLLLVKGHNVDKHDDPWLVRWLKRIYAPTLRQAVRWPIAITLIALCLLAAAVVAGGRLGRAFLPEFNEGALVVGIVTLPGTSLESSSESARLVEEALMRHPEIIAIGRRTGRAEEDEHVQGVEASEIDLTLDLEAGARAGRPRRSKDELLEALRKDLGGIPGIQATFGQPISHRIDHMLSGTRAAVAVKIFGSDLRELQRLAAEIKDVMQKVPGVVDLSSEQQTSIPRLRVDPDRAAMARTGVTLDAVEATTEACVLGIDAGEITEGRVAFGLRVFLDRGDVAPGESIRTASLATPSGRRVPLGAVARVSEDMGPNFISRENSQRKIVVTCNIADRDIGSVIDDVDRAITEKVALPPGYSVEYGGQFESARETGRLMIFLGIAVIVGIGVLLQLTFRSIGDVLLVMVNLPLAMIGGIAGVFLSGGVLSVASMIGFITVFGIAVRNGILMVTHIRHLQRHEGVDDFKEAVTQGAMERLAPILMTALAAGLALLPLAFRGDEPGTELLTPMAIVILGGLLSSTFLNMVVMPALFLRFGKPQATPVMEKGGVR